MTIVIDRATFTVHSGNTIDPRFPKPCPRVIAYPAWAARVAREKARDNARAVAVI